MCFKEIITCDIID